MSEERGTVRSAVGMGGITAVSRLVGFVRVLVVARVLGTTHLGDAFQSSNSVSNVVFELVAAGALSAVLVPAFVDLLDAGDQEGAEEVAGGVLGLAMTGLGILALIGVVAAPLIAVALTVGVPDAVAHDQRALVTFLLRFFIPQVVLYAAGTVATGVLYARRRFLPTAAAPIGNTVVMVAALIAFRVSAGAHPGLRLDATDRWLLVLAGTGGVVAFVGTLVIACRASGFRLRPRWMPRDRRVTAALRQAGWGVVLHSSAGALLLGAIVVGAAVQGGVVAYQVAWVFFLAPYAVLAQPIHTAILPELVGEARDDDRGRFRSTVRWGVERIALPLLPLSALLAAVALPAMRAAAVASSDRGSVLLAAALGSLAIGLFPYSAFLLLARASYALGDSRTPGLVALGVAGVGVVGMVLGGALTHGTARLASLGLAHSVAHLVGMAVLVRVLRRRLDGPLVPANVVRMAVVSVVVGVLGGAAVAVVGPDAGRAADAALAVGIAAACGLLVLAAYRFGGVLAGLGARVTHPVAAEDRHTSERWDAEDGLVAEVDAP